jgi:hypothetical protein
LESGILCASVDFSRLKTKATHMKTNIIILAALSGLTAVAALLLSFRSLVSADSIVGYASVLALLGMATLEYRINWKRLFGRS